MKKTFLYLLAAVALLAYELALVPFLPYGLSQMNLWLVILVFVALTYEFYQGVTFALLSAFLFDLYSTLPFGAIMIAIGATLAVVYVIHRRFLTNKSLYATLVLTGLATLVYSTTIFIYGAAVYFAETNDAALIYRLGLMAGSDFLRQLVMNLIGALILFLVFNASSRRFSAAFVDTVKT